jgi:hypothetical protein
MNTELIWHVHTHIIPAALALLPGKMDSVAARAEMLAIGLQESGFIARQQGGTAKTPGEGPAKSWWQFEKNGGVKEVLTAADTMPLILPICEVLGYPRKTPTDIHEAMEHNDVLAAVMARLLLWKDPRTMALQHEVTKGYLIYLARWRPNPEAAKKHEKDWMKNFQIAWSIVRA